MLWQKDAHLVQRHNTKRYTEEIEHIFKGYSCIYLEVCDNFGKTPFGDTEDVENEKEETEFSRVRESVVHILEKAKTVEYSTWDGLCQNKEDDAPIAEFYFFGMEDGKMFLFQFKWRYS